MIYPTEEWSGEIKEEDEGAVTQGKSMLNKSGLGVPQGCLCARNQSCPHTRKTSHVSLTSGSLGTLADLSRYKIT